MAYTPNNPNGQGTAANSVPVVIASDQSPVSTSLAPGSSSWGASVGQTSGVTATLVSNAGVPVGYQVLGLICSGTGEGFVAVKVNALIVLSGRIRASQPTLSISLPVGIPVSAGATVSLAVTNESGVAANFEGSLIGN